MIQASEGTIRKVNQELISDPVTLAAATITLMERENPFLLEYILHLEDTVGAGACPAAPLLVYEILTRQAEQEE